jgi:hypothetical protein
MNEYESFPYDIYESFPYDPDDEPVCVCPEYFGTTKVTWCKVCGDFTDNLEIALNEQAEEEAA